MSFKVSYLGKEKTFTKRVKIVDLLEKEDRSIICARVNNRLRELTYEIADDAKV